MSDTPQEPESRFDDALRDVDQSLRNANRAATDQGAKELIAYMRFATRRLRERHLAAPTPTTLEEWSKIRLMDQAINRDNQIVHRQNELFLEWYENAKASAGFPSGREIAKRASLHPNTIHAIERARVMPQKRTILKLAHALRVEAPAYLSTRMAPCANSVNSCADSDGSAQAGITGASPT